MQIIRWKEVALHRLDDSNPKPFLSEKKMLCFARLSAVRCTIRSPTRSIPAPFFRVSDVIFPSPTSYPPINMAPMRRGFLALRSEVELAKEWAKQMAAEKNKLSEEKVKLSEENVKLKDKLSEEKVKLSEENVKFMKEFHKREMTLVSDKKDLEHQLQMRNSDYLRLKEIKDIRGAIESILANSQKDVTGTQNRLNAEFERNDTWRSEYQRLLKKFNCGSYSDKVVKFLYHSLSKNFHDSSGPPYRLDLADSRLSMTEWLLVAAFFKATISPNDILLVNEKGEVVE